MTASYQLYARPNAGSLAVQVALEQMGAPYELIWISSSAADVERLRRVIPTGKIPALVLPDGTVLMESAAILIHLAAASPAYHLAPTPGSSEHARFLQWMVYLSANLYESVLRVYYPDRYSTRGEADAAAVRDRAKQDFLDHLRLIAAHLSPYLLGERYSIADAYLYMLAAWWPDDRALVYGAMPALQRHATLVAALPAMVKAEADHAG
jgi:glutathione S-transferase